MIPLSKWEKIMKVPKFMYERDLRWRKESNQTRHLGGSIIVPNRDWIIMDRKLNPVGKNMTDDDINKYLHRTEWRTMWMLHMI
jgi:hypothetical protein